MTVPRLGPKAFEQCAGFLRIRGGDDPLDASGVHPESYPVVRRILAKTGTGVAALIGDTKTLRALSPAEFTDAAFGLPTVSDILKELEKPGRDPRPEFRTATFAEGVHTLDDLEPGMVLEGVVTNVAAFGAFVDVGVHQDGLVHVSAMSASFVSDPRSVAKPGDVVRVKVLSVDTARQRISLTMRLDDGAARSGGSPRGSRPSSSRTEAPDSRPAPASPGRGAPRAHGNSAPRPDDRRPGKPATDRRGPRGDDQRGPRPDDRRGAPGGARAGARPDDRRGGPRRDDRPGQHDDDRRSPRPDDRRGAHGDDRRSPRPDDRRGAPAGDDRRGGPRPDDRRDGAAPPPSGAMAEALRRAGLLDESGAAEAKPGAAKPHRRDDRP
jgi:protein Tex